MGSNKLAFCQIRQFRQRQVLTYNGMRKNGIYMSEYHFLNLIISVLIALGKCGATILAIYFWWENNKIKLIVRSMHADSYGNIKPVEGGYFIVTLTNMGYRPLTIEMAGLKAYKRKYFCKRYIAWFPFDKTQFDSLPKRLEYGGSYIYGMPMKEMHKHRQALNKSKIGELKIFVCLPTARKDIHSKLDQESKSAILAL